MQSETCIMHPCIMFNVTVSSVGKKQEDKKPCPEKNPRTLQASRFLLLTDDRAHSSSQYNFAHYAYDTDTDIPITHMMFTGDGMSRYI